MAVGRLHCIYTKRLLLLVALLCGVDASQTYINKFVGETVEFPSDITTSISYLKWTYQNKKIAGYDVNSKDGIKVVHHFNGRLNLSTSNYNLKVGNLTLQDEGVFQVTGDNTDGSQISTKTYTLHVHESILKEPIFINHPATWHANQSCSVFLECNSQGYSNVSYNWTIEGQKYIGAQIHFLLQPPGADTNVTCITYNSLSNTSASITVKCTQTSPGPMWYVNYVAIPLGGTVVLALIIAAIAYCCRRHRNDSTDADIDGNNTIYADVNESIDLKNRSSSVTNPNSIYETVDCVNTPVQPKPHTIYDKIQFERQTNVQLSTLQNVC